MSSVRVAAVPFGILACLNIAIAIQNTAQKIKKYFGGIPSAINPDLFGMNPVDIK